MEPHDETGFPGHYNHMGSRDCAFQAGAGTSGQYVIGNQIYGRLRDRMSAAPDPIVRGTDWEEVFHGAARLSAFDPKRTLAASQGRDG